MSDPWQIYDELIDAIPPDVVVTAANTGLQWCRVTSSDGGIGMAYTLPWQSRPPMYDGETFAGRGLREIAGLVKSWNFPEAGIGMAAVNAWHNQPDRARENGFERSAGESWRQVFDPYSAEVAGLRLAVIGHFPFAPEPLAEARELIVLERAPLQGDYPDPACEYLLPGCDVVFISGSAFVNKTMPRLLELASGARIVMVGPSNPLSPVLFEHGVDVITGFVSPQPERLDAALANVGMAGMYDAGYRVERTSPSR